VTGVPGASMMIRCYATLRPVTVTMRARDTAALSMLDPAKRVVDRTGGGNPVVADECHGGAVRAYPDVAFPGLTARDATV
jgi:hypothetical protein